MIDLHCHILPALDDGAQSMHSAVEMAHMAVRSGVRAIVATPHCMDGGARQVNQAFRELQRMLQTEHIPLELYPGMEIFGTHKTPSLLKDGELFTLNNSRYPLVEFSFHSDGEAETAVLGSLLRAGYRPLVAHPERYFYIQEDPTLLNRWVDMGCLLQLNKGSLLGRFGQVPQALAMELVARGFACTVSSDAHSAAVRTPWLQDVRQLLEENFSPHTAQWLLHRNPLHILENQPLEPVRPAWFV